MRRLHTISLNEAEEAKLAAIRAEGNTVMDIFRAGMDALEDKGTNRMPKIIKTKKQAMVALEDVDVTEVEERECGCKRGGPILCLKHGRY